MEEHDVKKKGGIEIEFVNGKFLHLPNAANFRPTHNGLLIAIDHSDGLRTVIPTARIQQLEFFKKDSK